MVFKTIVDNIKSFFQKEEELEQESKDVPDSAIELFEGKGQGPNGPIVKHKLGEIDPSLKGSEGAELSREQKNKETSRKSRLPFSSKELRQRFNSVGNSTTFSNSDHFKRDTSTKSKASISDSSSLSRSSSQSSFSAQPPNPAKSNDDIYSQIQEFERVIDTIPGEDGSAIPLNQRAEHSRSSGSNTDGVSLNTNRSSQTSYPSQNSYTSSSYVANPSQSSQTPKGHGLFHKVSKRLSQSLNDKNKSESSAIDDEILDNPIESMKRHREEKIAEQNYLAESTKLEGSLKRILAELQELEQEWSTKQEEVAVAQERLEQIEAMISERSVSLKEFLTVFRNHSTKGENLFSKSSSTSSTSSTSKIQSDLSHSPYVSTSTSLPSSSYSSSQPSSSPHSSVKPKSSTSYPSQEQSSLSLPAEERFNLFKGGELSSLSDLRRAFFSMADEVFYHHVTPERNDFSIWIKEVFHRPELAEKVANSRTRYEAIEVLDSI